MSDFDQGKYEWGNQLHAERESLTSFFELMHEVDVPVDFMSKRPMNGLPQEFGVFDEETLLSSKRRFNSAHPLPVGTVLVSNNSQHYESIEAPAYAGELGVSSGFRKITSKLWRNRP
ncbi:MAG: hypothetical protein Q8O37_09595 [Sulfuricellaceae bacterium]|nr:hypothetical protein [Sulfuricellaceae bacterium]